MELHDQAPKNQCVTPIVLRALSSRECRDSPEPGQRLSRLGFKEQAIRDYETAGRLNPRLIASYGGTAKLLEEMGRQSLAVKNVEWPQQPDPAEAALPTSAATPAEPKEIGRGRSLNFTQVIALEPNRSDAYVARGWSRLCAGLPGGENDARAYLQTEGYRTRVSPYMTFLGYLQCAARREDR